MVRPLIGVEVGAAPRLHLMTTIAVMPRNVTFIEAAVSAVRNSSTTGPVGMVFDPRRAISMSDQEWAAYKRQYLVDTGQVRR
jgi:hypothetical protein